MNEIEKIDKRLRETLTDYEIKKKTIETDHVLKIKAIKESYLEFINNFCNRIGSKTRISEKIGRQQGYIQKALVRKSLHTLKSLAKDLQELDL